MRPQPAHIRRRSLRGLLHIQHHPLDFLLSRSANSDKCFNARFSKIQSIPVDVILEVAEHLQTSDVLSFSLTASRFRAVLLPILYTKVDLRSSRQCRIMLNVLASRPEITHHVRELVVRPNYYLSWPKPDEPLDELWVSRAIEKVAHNLQSLHTLVWDGLEMPEDRLWLTLREKCPKLKTVSSSVGMKALDPNSHLFKFENLVGFELIVRCGLNTTDLFPTMEHLPQTLWDMLLTRCPTLTDLIISCPSASPRLFHFEPIISARWPLLRSLNLGCVSYQADFSIGPTIDTAFAPFLAEHPTLDTLALQWNYSRWWSPETFPMSLPPATLPNLKNFSGLYQQLSELPNPGSIETLDLTFEPIPEMRVGAACGVLRNLTKLTTLDVWLYIPASAEDQGRLFRAFWAACPKLSDLHVMCTSPFTVKPLTLLSQTLPLLPSLTSFSLTKGHKYSDEPMLSSALRILRTNPRLKQIMVRWVRQACPNHCKQIGTYDVLGGDDVGLGLGAGGKSGKSAVQTQAPRALMVREKGVWMIGKDFSRRYRYDLPAGWDKERKRENRILAPGDSVGIDGV